MRRSLATFTLSSICFLSLAACASGPNSAMLMKGISPEDTEKTQLLGQMRSASDSVCVNFYNNSNKYLTASAGPNQSVGLLASLGATVLASVATGGIVGAGSSIGQIAAHQAAGTVASQGSRMVLGGLKGKDVKADRIEKVAQTAAGLGCPARIAA